MLIISALLFTLSSLGSGLSTHMYALTLSRLAGSFAIGLISTITPVYIGKISSISLKEIFITYNQVAIIIGIIIACIINYLFLNFAENWRWMLAFPSAFSILYLVLITVLPENASESSPQNREISKTKMIPLLAGIHIILYYTPFILNDIIYKP
ncbi:MAG: MFS transporter [Tannerellaceae bacterium]|nr:MFS transporter [Tannerellaceae bacterium]